MSLRNIKYVQNQSIITIGDNNIFIFSNEQMTDTEKF